MTAQEEREVVNKKEDQRPVKGVMIALTKIIYRIKDSDSYYVPSETQNGIHYFVKFDTESNYDWCSCPDSSTRGMKCKHILAVGFALMMEKVVVVDRLPGGVKKDNSITKSAWTDEYEF